MPTRDAASEARFEGVSPDRNAPTVTPIYARSQLASASYSLDVARFAATLETSKQGRDLRDALCRHKARRLQGVDARTQEDQADHDRNDSHDQKREVERQPEPQ